jgi:hypothetical protein
MHDNSGFKFADAWDGLEQSGGKIKAAALPVSGEVLCATVDRSIRLDFSWTADAYEGSDVQAFLVSGSHQPPHHLNEFLDRIITAQLLFAVPPQLEFPNLGLGEVSGTFHIKVNNPGTDVRTTYVHGEYGVMGLENPGWRKLDRTEQSSFVWLIADGSNLDFDLESASFFVLNATRRPAYHACFEGQHEFRESIAF